MSITVCDIRFVEFVTTGFQPEKSENFEELHRRSPNWKNCTYQASFRFEVGEFKG